MTSELMDVLEVVAAEDCNRNNRDHDFVTVHIEVAYDFYGLSWHQARATERCKECGALKILTWKTDIVYAVG